jgi:dnd system-associated protein 4
MERRIGVSQAHAKTLEALVSLVGGESYPLFETKQKALMFAAALGYHISKREPLGARDAGSAIRFDVFEKNLDDGFVACLGVACARDLGVLGDSRQEELATIFEEYACAGLSELQKRVLGVADPLQALLALMNLARHPQTETEIEGLDPSVLKDLMRG